MQIIATIQEIKLIAYKGNKSYKIFLSVAGQETTRYLEPIVAKALRDQMGLDSVGDLKGKSVVFKK